MTDSTTVSDLQRETDAFRQRLIRMDRQASAVLSQSYDDVLKALQPRIDALEAQIAERIASGEPFSPSWLFQQERYRELQRQTRRLIDQYGQVTQAVTTAAQQAAMRASLLEAGQMLAPISGGSPEVARLVAGWAAVPDATIQRMVGALQESTPLGQLFATYGRDAVQDVNRALIRGAALGLGPRDTARAVRQALGITRARSEAIVRTETLRASNSALLAAFAESGVVSGWRWSASLSLRTCAACLSRHGKVYPLSKAMDRHVNCRCSASPVVDGAFDEWESGSDWLKRQPPGIQDGILGKEGGSLFRSGDLLLEDFERVTQSRAWGASVTDGGVSWAKRQAARRPLGKRQPMPEQLQPAPEWRPVMNAQDAARWSQSSALPGRYFHTTADDRLVNITTEGFRLDADRRFGRVWGNGVYLSENAQTTAIYQRAGTTTLSTRVNVSNVFVYATDGVPAGASPLHLSSLAAQHPRGTRLLSIQADLQKRAIEANRALMDHTKYPPRSPERRAFLAQRDAEGLNDIPATAITQWADEEGIDAIRILVSPENERFRDVGGDQLIVFNPRAIVIEGDV